MSPPPLEITLAGRPARLEAGARTSLRVAEAYRDTSASSMRRVLDRIHGQEPWKDAVRAEFAETNRWLCDIVTHPSRTRFLDLHRPTPGALVLDVGAGWGQTTLPLASTNPVVALEPTPERLEFIEAAAGQMGTRGNIYFLEASMTETDFDPVFDYIACIGVLEWVPKFDRRGEPRAVQLEFLRRLRRSLAPRGRCCLGIENRLGLKYLLGARDDHTGLAGVNVFDAQLATARHRSRTGEELRVLTYSLAEYRTLFREAGFLQVEAYAAFPDYKLPELILPIDPAGPLNEHILSASLPLEHDGVDGSCLPNQDELRSHYRSFAELGLAHVFAPSFFFLLE